MSPSEIAEDISPGELSSKLEAISQLYVLSNRTIMKGQSFEYHKTFKVFPNPLLLVLTQDTQIDMVSRRIVTYFDLERRGLNEDFNVAKKFSTNVSSVALFKDDFPYLETRQVYMKVWPWFHFNETILSSASLGEELASSLKDKVVILGTSGIYSMNSIPSLMRRMNFSTELKMSANYWPASHLVATYLTNIVSGEYVRQPKVIEEWAWIFLCALLFFCSLVFTPVTEAFWISSLVLALYIFIGLVVFRLGSLNFDTGKLLVIGIVTQYVVLPLRYLRRIRRLDREKHQKQQEIIEERLKSRALVKAATMESVLRMVGQVSHDIRSPLMALQVANSLMKNQVSDDLRDLVDNATMRIRSISEDLFQRYKTKGSEISEVETNLSSALGELIASYQKVHATAHFSLNIPPEIKAQWPLYSIQRSFSNLVNNSLDACYAKNIVPEIRISAEVVDDRIHIYNNDNGPGIPSQIVPKLFKEGATFNKLHGTGLGLYQVQRDIELIGGTISYISNDKGACFEISVPKMLEAVKFVVSPLVVIVESSEFSRVMSSVFQKSGAEVVTFSDIQSAKRFLTTKNADKKVTLICDLLFPNQEETGFDLIDACETKQLYKAVLCTSLTDNLEIQEMANKRGALLVRRSFLEQIQVSVFGHEVALVRQ